MTESSPSSNVEYEPKETFNYTPTAKDRRYAASLERRDLKKEAKKNFKYGTIVNQEEWDKCRTRRSER